MTGGLLGNLFAGASGGDSQLDAARKQYGWAKRVGAQIVVKTKDGQLVSLLRENGTFKKNVRYEAEGLKIPGGATTQIDSLSYMSSSDRDPGQFE